MHDPHTALTRRRALSAQMRENSVSRRLSLMAQASHQALFGAAYPALSPSSKLPFQPFSYFTCANRSAQASEMVISPFPPPLTSSLHSCMEKPKGQITRHD